MVPYKLVLECEKPRMRAGVESVQGVGRGKRDACPTSPVIHLSDIGGEDNLSDRGHGVRDRGSYDEKRIRRALIDRVNKYEL